MTQFVDGSFLCDCCDLVVEEQQSLVVAVEVDVEQWVDMDMCHHCLQVCLVRPLYEPGRPVFEHQDP